MVNVAVPVIYSPPACKPKTEHVTFQRGDGGHGRAGSKCKHAQSGEPKSRARAQQSVSSRASSMGRWNVTCMGSIRRKTHGALPRHTTNSEHTSGAMECYTLVRFAGKLTSCARNAHSKSQHSSGAMEEMRQKVQNASTHILRRKNTSTHTTAGQCKGQSKGAMDEMS